MPKGLERDLGLYATITISIGAMIGSGIFVLPGLAVKIAGPAAILAYLLAGLIVLPAALSKAEMATAMPEAGGTYLFIDRAMGPLPGTVAGVGAWFSLVFKSAFALVGLGAYLLLFAPVPAGVLQVVALGLAVVLLAVNVVGVKQSGGLQAAVVTLVLFALVVFIADGITYVHQPRYHPFFGHGAGGLFAATGFVFVSYAGVTKIASVAEEVEDPGRNIPIAILLSVGVMMLVYTFVVFVVVGVTPAADLLSSLTPMAEAAGAFAGDLGRTAVAVVAVLALVSMANAGILSSTRFPLAMSRDSLAPARLGRVHERYRTPVSSIAFTGAILLALIAFVPVVDLAKLASAFQILVFAMVNAALIAFCESGLTSYDPEFVAPGYPWVPLAGLLACLGLLTVMGPVPLLGALALVALGVGWYRLYGRERTEREGAALDAIRRSSGDASLQTTQQLMTTGGKGGVLVATGPETDRDTEASLLRVADAVLQRRGGELTVSRFETVPQQVSLTYAAADYTVEDETFEQESAELAASLSTPVDVEEVVSHEAEHAVASYVTQHETNLVVGEWEPDRFGGEFLGHDVDWFLKHVPADFVFVRDRGIGDVDTIAVIADRGPYDPLEVLVADALARTHGAEIQFLYATEGELRSDRVDTLEAYHADLGDLCSVPTDYEILHGESRTETLLAAADDADLAVASTSPHHPLYDAVVETLPDRLARDLHCTVLLVHTHQPRRHTFLRYLLERFVF
ncbi:MAG: APC family permease [Haloferacaceae archaeon]